MIGMLGFGDLIGGYFPQLIIFLKFPWDAKFFLSNCFLKKLLLYDEVHVDLDSDCNHSITNDSMTRIPAMDHTLITIFFKK